MTKMETTSTVIPYFLYSSGILLREGLEALLVIIALVAGTREAGQEARARDVYAGGLLAIGVSIALAWAVNHVIGDNTSDTLEGVFQLTAAATLFYVSSWMTAKSQAQQWNSFIRAQVDAAKRSKGPSIALGLTAFLAVMREGAETIVFFQALVSGATERAERHAVFPAWSQARSLCSDFRRPAQPGQPHPDWRVLLGHFNPALCAGSDIRRPGNRELSGIGRDERDLHQSSADAADVRVLPHGSDYRRAGDPDCAGGGRRVRTDGAKA